MKAKKIIKRNIKNLENLAEEYIQELDNSQKADECFFAIYMLQSVLIEIKQNEK